MIRIIFFTALTVFLISCTTKKDIFQYSELKVYSEEGNSESQLTLNLDNNSYTFYTSPTGSKIVGIWHLSNDTLTLEPKFEYKNTSDSIQKTDIIDSESIVCIIKNKNIYMHSENKFPNNQQSERSSTYRKFIQWR